MSRVFLRRSLAAWRRRLAYRHRRLTVAEKARDQARIDKWTRLCREAEARIERRKAQLAPTLQDRAWTQAGLCVGIREVGGNNRGARVQTIIDYAGGDHGEPYCVDGVIWCYGHAGSKVVRPGYPRAVHLMLVDGVIRTSSPETGDPVRFTFDHTGLFGGWLRKILGRWVRCPRALATHIRTREFNTSGAGALSSDANDGTDGVYEKVRAKELVADFLRVLR